MSVDIVAENALSGTYTFNQMVTSGYGDISVAGFARQLSVNVGETVELCTDGAPAEARVIRAGWYGGVGFRQVDTLDVLPATQPEAEVIPDTNGATTCTAWSVTAEWQVPADATSGMYPIMIRNAANNNAFYATVVVRDDEAETDIIVVTSESTWGNAYNYYGTKATPRGKNVYGVGGVGDIQQRALAGSYHRPVITRGEVEQTFWWACELPIYRFIERNGFSVKYITQQDIHREGVDILLKAHTVIIAGHSEYWSQNAWDALLEYRDVHGHKVIQYSANDFFWRVDYEQRGDETIMHCKKDTMPGPVGTGHVAGQPFVEGEWQGTWIDTRWPDRPTDDEQNPNGIFGMNGVYDYAAELDSTATYARHKVWDYSPLNDYDFGDLIVPGIIGFEADHWKQYGPDESYKVLAEYSRPAPGGLSDENGQIYSVPGNIRWGITSRRVASGGLTVDANTCQMGWALDTAHDRGQTVPVSPALQQFTINLLVDMGCQPATLMSGMVLRSPASLNDYGRIPGTTPGWDNGVSAIFRGDQPVSAAYLGNDLIWSA